MLQAVDDEMHCAQAAQAAEATATSIRSVARTTGVRPTSEHLRKVRFVHSADVTGERKRILTVTNDGSTLVPNHDRGQDRKRLSPAISLIRFAGRETSLIYCRTM